MDFLLPIIAGFTLGCIHAFDADHIVAVTAFASKTRNALAAARFGFVWGLGHTATLVLLGLFSLAFRFIIPPMVESVAEMLVGLLLIAIGVWVLRGVVQRKHVHEHTHNGVSHVHLHSHAQSEDHHHGHSMFLVGATHGFAGTASVMVMVPVAITQTISVAALYLLLFGIGTVMAMSVFAFTIGQVVARLNSRSALPLLQGISGFLSIGFGCIWIGDKIL